MRGAREGRESGQQCLLGLALIVTVIAMGWGALALYSQKALVFAGLN